MLHLMKARLLNDNNIVSSWLSSAPRISHALGGGSLPQNEFHFIYSQYALFTFPGKTFICLTTL